MPTSPSTDDREPTDPAMRDRVLASYGGGSRGPTSVFIAGLHGNEPLPIEAVRRVFDDLADRRPPFRGRAFGLLGHLRAIDRGRRFLDQDLNRAFRYHYSDGLAMDPALRSDDLEGAELDGLLTELRRIAAGHDARDELFAIDLHTFSSAGPPFAIFSDTLRNRRFARCLPIPFILGLTEQIPGTATEYFTAAGCVSIVVETGRHDDPESARLHEAAIRLMLVRAGHVSASAFDDLGGDRRRLAHAARGTPRVLDVLSRYGTTSENHFRMRPGFANFTPVTAGQQVADDAHGAVTVQRSGRILLPRYQPEGNDGFFIARPIGRSWLRLSSLLRRAGVSRFVPLLPGIQRHPRVPHALVVREEFAEPFALDLFHLLGYRRIPGDGRELVVARRPFDLRPPREVRF
jgi:succinylglutamate desuccinylase